MIKIFVKKKSSLLFIVLLFFPFSLWSQKYSDIYTRNQLENANTASSSPLFNADEKEIIQLINMVRTNGKLFSEQILLPFLSKEKSTRDTRSLIRDLNKIRGLPMLKPDSYLAEIAMGHATQSGRTGTTGHQRFKERYKPVLGSFKEVAENCAYGYDAPLDIVIRLLIDEGIKNKGHRKNLLNSGFNRIGVSIQPHKKYRYNCVMSFGKKGN